MTARVVELQRLVEQAFTDGVATLRNEVRVIVADQAARGSLHSGQTVRRIVRATEDHIAASVRPGRVFVDGTRSTVLRLKRRAFEAAGVARMLEEANGTLDQLGLWNDAARALMAEATARGTRAAEPADPTPKPNPWPGRVKKAAAYLAHNVLLAIVLAVVIAFILVRLGLSGG